MCSSGVTAWKLKAVDKGEEQGKENCRNGKRTLSN
jgi:predicted secreted protein